MQIAGSFVWKFQGVAENALAENNWDELDLCLEIRPRLLFAEYDI